MGPEWSTGTAIRRCPKRVVRCPLPSARNFIHQFGAGGEDGPELATVDQFGRIGPLVASYPGDLLDRDAARGRPAVCCPCPGRHPVSDSYPQVTVASASEWDSWLRQQHATSPGIWLVTAKKGHPGYLSYDEIVDTAISYGWVDSLPRTAGPGHSKRLLTPLHPGSNWSRVNKQRVERLTAAGQMTPAGLAVVEAARGDGTWTALDTVEDLTEPAALTTALDATPAARANWDAFPRSAKRAILEWIGTAKTDTTRNRRIRQTASEAVTGRRANQWRQPKTRRGRRLRG